MGPSPDAELVVDALVMALGRAEPDPDGLVHHSDKGGAYLSGDFCSMADVSGLQVSFGSTGDCFDCEDPAVEIASVLGGSRLSLARGGLTLVLIDFVSLR